MATELPPLLAAGVRFCFAGTLLTLILYRRGLSLPGRARDWRLAGAAALSGIVLSNGLSVLALRHVGSNQVALVSASDLPAFFGPKHLWRWLKSRCDSHR